MGLWIFTVNFGQCGGFHREAHNSPLHGTGNPPASSQVFISDSSSRDMTFSGSSGTPEQTLLSLAVGGVG